MEDHRAQFPPTTAHLIGLLGIVVVAFGFMSAHQFRMSRIAHEKLAAMESEIAALESRGLLEQVEGSAVALQLGVIPRTPATGAPVANLTHEETLTGIVSRAAPAVVSIVLIEEVPKYQVRYIDPFRGNSMFDDSGFRIPMFDSVGTERTESGVGTGFFVRPDGHIVTNRHVVADADAAYAVLLFSGERREARVLYRDEATDVALLKVEGSGYPVLSLGESADLKLGQTVIAIGNALGEYNNTVSTGIVSGLNRTITAQDEYGRLDTLSGVIQTDAAINRGNSGGPMLDLSGRVTGVNVAMELGASNIAFAIPIDAVRVAVDRLLK